MKKALIISIMLAVIAALVAGCGGGGGDPAEVIDKAYVKGHDYKTAYMEYDAQIGVEGDLSSIDPSLSAMMPINLGVNGNALIDNSDQENPAVKGSVNLTGLDEMIKNATAASGGDEASAALGAGMVGSMMSNLEFALVDQVFYIKMMGGWYQLDTSSAVAEAAPEAGDVDTSCFQDATKDIKPSQVLSDIEEVGSADVGGEKTTHYKAKIDIDKLIDTATQVMRDCDQAEVAGGLEGAKAELADTFSKLDVELYIDGDSNLRKATLDVELSGSALSDLMGSTSTTMMGNDEVQAMESLSVTFVVNVTLSKFNEDVEITAPEGAMPLEDLLSGLGSSLGGDLGGDLGGLEDITGGSLPGATTSTPSIGTGTSTNPYSY